MNYKNYIQFTTIARRECQRMFAIWGQTLLPAAISMGLYFIIFGTFIGGRIATVQGFSYVDFIAPGLIMMSVIDNSYSQTVWSFFGCKYHRNIEELLVSPTPAWILIAGFVAGGLIRGVLVSVIVAIIATFFTTVKIHSMLVVISFVILVSISFSLAGMLNAIFAKDFDDISIIPTFILTPLTYLGGVFYPLESLPAAWKNLSLLNPIVYMVNGFRYGFLGKSDVSLAYAIFILLALIVLLFSLNLYLIRRGVGIKS